MDFFLLPDILNCKLFADRYVEKLFASREDVPIARVGHAFAAIAFVGERMQQRLTESAFPSRSAIKELVTGHLSGKLDQAEIDTLVKALTEQRKPLVEVRHDVDFLVEGAYHELNMVQVAKEGSWRVVNKVEGGVAVPKGIRQRVKYVQPEVKAEEKKKEKMPSNRGGGGAFRGKKGGRGRAGGPAGVVNGVQVCLLCKQPGHFKAQCPLNANKT